MTELATMTLVHSDDGGHARGSSMVREGRSRPQIGRWTRPLRRLAVIAGVWTVVVMFNTLSVSVRTASGEIRPAPG